MKNFLGLILLLMCVAGWTSGHSRAEGGRPSPAPTPTPQLTDRGKKNSRPDPQTALKEGQPQVGTGSTPVYFYEFLRPGFSYGKVSIEHDEEGRGKISFLKDGDDETITDPIRLSPVTMGKIKQSLTDLDFLNSIEEYQHERDFSNLGNVTLTVRKAGRERTVKYNWTTNKSAKELMDEYRRISNEYTWLFEFNVARVNQPLRTPAMMAGLDGYLRRNEISDPSYLLPFLKDVTVDEKLPLIARNHATKLIKHIEKSGK